ncbi:unnamed protein product [Caenorhabditis nigoni]
METPVLPNLRMPSIPLITFLGSQCPGWERRPVEVVNLCLAQIWPNNSASSTGVEAQSPEWFSSSILAATTLGFGSLPTRNG